MNLGIIGAIAGLGQGIANAGTNMIQQDNQDALFQRQRELEQMRIDAQKELQQSGQTFQRGERIETQGFTAGQNQLNRDQRDKEFQQTYGIQLSQLGLHAQQLAEAARHNKAIEGNAAQQLQLAKQQLDQSGIQFTQDQDGNAILMKKDGTAQPVLGADGKPIKMAGKGSAELLGEMMKGIAAGNNITDPDLQKKFLNTFVPIAIGLAANRAGGKQIVLPGQGGQAQTNQAAPQSTAMQPSAPQKPAGVINSYMPQQDPTTPWAQRQFQITALEAKASNLAREVAQDTSLLPELQALQKQIADLKSQGGE